MAVKRKTLTRSAPKRAPQSSSRSRSTTKSSRSTTKGNTLKLVKNVNLSHLDKACNKTQLLSLLCDMTGQPRKQIQQTLECLQQVISAHMKKQGPGEFVMPGMLKMKLKHKPATKAKKGINPFTGEPTMFKAKPARNVVKITALKKLKELVN
jgi:nucleoid DNA-binding protein